MSAPKRTRLNELEKIELLKIKEEIFKYFNETNYPELISIYMVRYQSETKDLRGDGSLMMVLSVLSSMDFLRTTKKETTQYVKIKTKPVPWIILNTFCFLVVERTLSPTFELLIDITNYKKYMPLITVMETLLGSTPEIAVTPSRMSLEFDLEKDCITATASILSLTEIDELIASYSTGQQRDIEMIEQISETTIDEEMEGAGTSAEIKKPDNPKPKGRKKEKRSSATEPAEKEEEGEERQLPDDILPLSNPPPITFVSWANKESLRCLIRSADSETKRQYLAIKNRGVDNDTWNWIDKRIWRPACIDQLIEDPEFEEHGKMLTDKEAERISMSLSEFIAPKLGNTGRASDSVMARMLSEIQNSLKTIEDNIITAEKTSIISETVSDKPVYEPTHFPTPKPKPGPSSEISFKTGGYKSYD